MSDPTLREHLLRQLPVDRLERYEDDGEFDTDKFLDDVVQESDNFKSKRQPSRLTLAKAPRPSPRRSASSRRSASPERSVSPPLTRTRASSSRKHESPSSDDSPCYSEKGKKLNMNQYMMRLYAQTGEKPKSFSHEQMEIINEHLDMEVDLPIDGDRVVLNAKPGAKSLDNFTDAMSDAIIDSIEVNGNITIRELCLILREFSLKPIQASSIIASMIPKDIFN